MSKQHIGWTLKLLGLMALAMSSPAAGQDDPVKATREIMADSLDLPWYDEEQDRLQRVDVTPPEDLDNRHSRWQSAPVERSIPEWLWTLLETVGWIILALVLAAVTYWLIRTYWLTDLLGGSDDVTVTRSEVAGANRVEHLPFPLEGTDIDLLAAARRHYEEGNYGQAMIYLYSYLLIELDRSQHIRLARGKTNRQYVRELASWPSLQKILFPAMIAFEDVFFGHHRLDRNRFEKCWERLEEFQQQLAFAIDRH